MSAVIPFYCNPFFRRCKHFFRKIENIFHRMVQISQDCTGKPPESLPNPGQNRAQGSIHNDGTQKSACQVSDPQVAPAHPECQPQPSPAAAQQEQKIRPLGELPTQRAEKAIPEPQARPQSKGPGRLPGGHRRGRQPRKRPNMPRDRGS